MYRTCKTIKANAHKAITTQKVLFDFDIKERKVTVHKESELYRLELKGYSIKVEINDHKITIKNVCGSNQFIFDTVRNPVTKERWQAIAQLIIEATKLI